MKIEGEMLLTKCPDAGFALQSPARRELIVIVSPEDAQWLIGHMHPNNRKSTHLKVGLHVRNMREGKFVQPSEPGIYVDRQGRVCNAGHRLRAQVQAGVTLRWRITLGASIEEIRALDQVRSRRGHEGASLADGIKISAREEAVIRQFLRLEESGDSLKVFNQTLTPEDLIAAHELYGADIGWAMESIPSTAGPASLLAAVAFARACDPPIMQSFAETYVSARLAKPGSYKEGDPALSLAQFMINQRLGAGGTFTNEVVLKTLAACRAALSRKTLKRLYAAEEAVAWVKSRRKTDGNASGWSACSNVVSL